MKKQSGVDDAANSNTATEDQVFLLAPIFDSETNTSLFAVLEGGNLSASPIFEVCLSSHIP